MGFLGMDFVCFWMEISFDCGVFDEDCERCMFMMYLKALKAFSVEFTCLKLVSHLKQLFHLQKISLLFPLSISTFSEPLFY